MSAAPECSGAMLGRGLCWLLCALVAMLLPAGVLHAAVGPSVRVQVQEKQPVLVGQPVHVDVTVVAPNFFTSAPPFPSVQVDGAIVTLPDQRATNGVEHEGEQTLATIRKSYLFTAQQAGEFELPPVKIDFTWGGDDGKPQQAHVTWPATKIVARLPGGVQPGEGVPLPVGPMTVQQSFDRPLDGLAAGDALVRTVEIRAPGTQAMLIPPPRFEAPDGVRMFQADPVVEDRNDSSGQFAAGVRIERVTYVFQSAGRYRLPAVRVEGLNARTQKVVAVQAPEVQVKVSGAASLGERIAPDALPMSAAEREPLPWVRLAVGLLILLVLGGLAWWARQHAPAWRARWAARQAREGVSDKAMFQAVLDACARTDAQAAQRALLAWSALHPRMRPKAWAESLDDSALAEQITELERRLYGPGAQGSQGPQGWPGPAMAAQLRSAHARWLAADAGTSGHHRPGRPLPPLNPLS